MTLAQEAPILLLDEPTAHLDIRYQIEILELLRRLNAERGLTVLAALMLIEAIRILSSLGTPPTAKLPPLPLPAAGA